LKRIMFPGTLRSLKETLSSWKKKLPPDNELPKGCYKVESTKGGIILIRNNKCD